MFKKTVLPFILSLIMLTAISCREKTTEEKLEDSVEEVGDSLEDAADDAGDAIEDAVDDSN